MTLWRRWSTATAGASSEADSIDILHKACPKFDERPPGQRPELIVIHFSATRTIGEIFDIFLAGPRQVSSHYVIDDDGTVFQLVDEAKRAWHAGRSSYLGLSDVNSRSIGIELRNGGCLTPAGDGARFRTVTGRLSRPRNQVLAAGGHWWESFAEAQMGALARLCREISTRYHISPDHMVGHDQVATPPGRKIDPGPLFHWDRLRRESAPKG